jgi:outer membrane biosynthesis protein TonB
MTDNAFESKKNMQAGTITVAILGLLLLFLLLVGWTTPTILQPVPEEGIEVNLGNSDAGLGTDQAFEPGKPTPQDQQQYTPPKPVAAEKEAIKDIATNDKDAEAAEIKKPVIANPKPDATKYAEKEAIKKVIPKKVEAPTPPAPAPPKPKAIFKGVNGTGTGGNDADSYKKGGNEGIAGGKGDQGSPGGNPDSKNYKGGGHGNSGMSISRGLEGRYVARAYNYQGDFDTNEKVAVDVKVDNNGNVLSASYQPRGSTTSAAGYKDKAIEIVRKSKLNANANGGEEQFGTIIVNFKINH